MIEEAFSIVSDPGHMLAEAMFVVIEMAILSPLVAWGVRAHDRRKHGADHG
jgi:hypothetical protein